MRADVAALMQDCIAKGTFNPRRKMTVAAADDRQRALFGQALDLLGQRAMAQATGMSDRHLRALRDGKRALHAGILEDACRALLAHADQARTIERQLNPGFARNLTDRQREPLHPTAAHHRASSKKGPSHD